jgi:hypothetical protein
VHVTETQNTETQNRDIGENARHRAETPGRRARRLPVGGTALLATTALAVAVGGALAVGGVPTLGDSHDDVALSAAANTLLSDGFEAGLGAWSKSGGTWQVGSVAGRTGAAALRQTSTSNANARLFAGPRTWGDYTVSARVKLGTTAGSASFAGIVARSSSNSNAVRLVLGAGTAKLQLVADGAVVATRSVTVATSGWLPLAVTVSGTTATATAGSTTVGSVGGAAKAGRVGLVTSTATAAFDDVLVTGSGAVTAPTAPATTTPTSKPTATEAPTKTTTTAPPKTPTRTPTTEPTKPAGTFAAWPTPKETVPWNGSPRKVTGTFDGGLKRFVGGGDGDQDESQPPVFEVADGSVLKNVVIGVPAGDGVHCTGTCTLQNVWWEDVGEDAATLKGSSAGQVMTIDGGGARHASDKTFQHNGPGRMVIKSFQLEDFGKLYRSCGNCSKQFQRTVVVENVLITAPGKTLVGINTNYGDTATLSGITIAGDRQQKISICDRFTGNSSGDEPTKTGSGPDGTFCRYDPAAVVYR